MCLFKFLKVVFVTMFVLNLQVESLIILFSTIYQSKPSKLSINCWFNWYRLRPMVSPAASSNEGFRCALGEKLIVTIRITFPQFLTNRLLLFA